MSVGLTAIMGRNTLCTWHEARRFLDTRMENFRQSVLLQVDKDTGKAAFLHALNYWWDVARKAIARKVLPRRRKKGRYDQAKTVNWDGKVLRKDSRKRKAKRRKMRDKWAAKPSSRPVKGRKRGRPKMTDAQKKAANKANAARKAKKRHEKEATGAHNYPSKRAKAGQGKPRAVGRRYGQARQLQGLKLLTDRRREDRRHNHDTLYAYLFPPMGMRQRRSPKQMERWGPNKPSKKVGSTRDPRGRKRAELLIAARAAVMAARKSKRMRTYWRKVKKSAGKAA